MVSDNLSLCWYFKVLQSLYGFFPSTLFTIGITVFFMFHRSFFLILLEGLRTYLFFRFLFFIHCFYFFIFSFFIYLFILFITWSGLPADIRFYLKIPENFVHLIPQNWFWVVNIPLVCMVKIQFLARFPLDLFQYPVMSSPLLFWR